MKSHNIRSSVLLALTLATTPTLSDPNQVQSHDSILAAAKSHLVEALAHQIGKSSIEITSLDHRLRLIQCAEPLETFLPSSSKTMGKTTVGVRCHAPKPWTLYVTANIAIQGPVVIAVRDLSRGAPIEPSDIRLVERDTSNLLRGHFDALNQVVGRTLKRSLRRDQVITPSLLVVWKTIKRGQEITILAGSGGVEVRMKGKAMRSGNPGELIPIQNLSSKKKLDARVVSAGIVRID